MELLAQRILSVLPTRVIKACVCRRHNPVDLLAIATTIASGRVCKGRVPQGPLRQSVGRVMTEGTVPLAIVRMGPLRPAAFAVQRLTRSICPAPSPKTFALGSWLEQYVALRMQSVSREFASKESVWKAYKKMDRLVIATPTA